MRNSQQPEDIDAKGRGERRLWLIGTVLMAVAPAKFAFAALSDPAPLDPALAEAIRAAVLTPPVWLTQIVGPIDRALRSSGPQVLPALVALFFLLRLWFRYGRTLFQATRSRRA